MTAVHGGSPARRALAVLSTLILTAGGLAIGAPARATPVDPDNPDRLSTFIDCQRGANGGRMHLVVPAGPGRVWVFGSVRACRSPKPTDTVLITDVDHELARPAGGRSHVYYQRAAHGVFGRAVTLSATTRRLCLSDSPDGALDCYSVRVPSRKGELGVPVVGGRTTTRNVTLDSYFGFCGSCW